MRRGTTPTNTFSVPIDLSTATVFITYAQNNRTVKEVEYASAPPSGDNKVGTAKAG